ncbi:MAG: class I SAM-dependent methyltransferase [Candidatus Omnitrophica bacterium]|nr:class I SAM-dependent methyltransferase [Candidatus Omnitrophota bacterium]
MEQLFYQREWQGIAFKELPGVDWSACAARGFYAAFYEQLLSRSFQPAPEWVESKRRIGAWLASTIRARAARGVAPRILSVGAGLGIVERVLDEARYHVDVLECEPHSLKHLQSHLPGAGVILGDARHIPCRTGSYDAVYMSNVDYCFDRSGYTQVWREMGRILRPGGLAVCVSSSNLSVRAVARGIRRRWLRRSVRGPSHLVWGYRRTVGEHVRAGRQAALVCDAVYVFDHEFNPRAIRPAASVRLGWPTWADAEIAVVCVKR